MGKRLKGWLIRLLAAGLAGALLWYLLPLLLAPVSGALAQAAAVCTGLSFLSPATQQMVEQINDTENQGAGPCRWKKRFHSRKLPLPLRKRCSRFRIRPRCWPPLPTRRTPLLNRQKIPPPWCSRCTRKAWNWGWKPIRAELIRQIQERVFAQAGVRLEPEVRIID